MIFDAQGLPRDTGATDFMDSCRLAGLMVLVEDSRAPKMEAYMINGMGVRHPIEAPSNNPLNFTRDQMMILAAGLAKQGRQDLALQLYRGAQKRWCRAQNIESDVPGSSKKFPDGADILSPSHMGHLRRCAGLSRSWFGSLWLIIDILSDSHFSPYAEPNQLMAMCMIAGPFYVKLLRKMNKSLNDAIMGYWNNWRCEPFLARALISTFK